jgi:ferredoxin-NADP reductase/ferredoxin
MSTARIASADFEIVLSTTDRVDKTIRCGPAMTVLQAAERLGIVLPSLCQSGSCGSCAAAVVDGEYLLGSHSEQALGRNPASGAVLLCRTYPRSDCAIRLPYDSSRISDSLPPEREATIVSLENVARSTVRVELSMAPAQDGSPGAEFDPGQVVALQLPGRSWKRVYSLANTANWEGLLELYIRLHADGLFATYLARDAAVGDTLLVHGPQGAFAMPENGMRPRWFVSGGTGIVPVLSMLRRMAEWGDPQPARLYAGFNDEADLFTDGPIDQLAAALPDFRAEVCLWRPNGGDGWWGFTGTPVDAVKRDLAGLNEPPDVYVCGPPALIEAAEDALRAGGVPASQIFAERITAN